MNIIITDHVFREAAPYLDGRPDDVYWAGYVDENGNKHDKYVRIDGIWKHIFVGPSESDIVDPIKEKELYTILNNLI